jgi:5-oxoprolinase (ATP-hydrolysing)
VLDSGISSIAVVLKHAAIYPDHEKVVGQLAKQMGFTQVRLLPAAAMPLTDSSRPFWCVALQCMVCFT